jgi:hypothetical protein
MRINVANDHLSMVSIQTNLYLRNTRRRLRVRLFRYFVRQYLTNLGFGFFCG